ncbi:MAG: DUF5680 domain-containing protein [Thermoactinomyces sp.]
MDKNPSLERIAEFIVRAKKNTYVKGGDDFSGRSIIPGFNQLDYQEGDLYYRDNYCGFSPFSGQETVYVQNKPVWTMSYYGRILAQDMEKEAIAKLYRFLRQALNEVPLEHPYRGPMDYGKGDYRYTNEINGMFTYFYGREGILVNGEKIYELRYFGGCVE